MCLEDTVRIPLRAKDGSVRAYVTVDAVDADWVNRWRWALSGGYAYRTARVDGRKVTVWLHRALLGLVPGDRIEGDHIDRDRLGCRRSNLRILTGAANSQNVGARGGSSQYRGVSWDKAKGKWLAQARAGGMNHHLGRFSTELEAAEAARVGRRRLMPYALD